MKRCFFKNFTERKGASSYSWPNDSHAWLCSSSTDRTDRPRHTSRNNNNNTAGPAVCSVRRPPCTVVYRASLPGQHLPKV